MTRRIFTAREQAELLSPWRREAALVFPWRESEAYPGKGFFADLENGHNLSALPPHPRDPSRGWDWWLWHGQRDDHGERPVTGGGQRWRNDSRAHSTDHLPTAEHAMKAAEEAYAELFPIGTDTGSHDSGVDYDAYFNKGHDEPDEDYGHIFGMRLAGYGGEWHEELYDENGDYVGPQWPQDMAHHLNSDPVQAPYNAGYHAAWHPAFADENDRLGVAESAWHAVGGKPNSSDPSQDFASFEDGWMDSVNEVPHKFLDPQAHQAHFEGELDEQRKWQEQNHEKAIKKHFDPYPGWDPDEGQDPFDPRLIGAALRRLAFDWKPDQAAFEGTERYRAALENGHVLAIQDHGSKYGWNWALFTNEEDSAEHGPIKQLVTGGGAHWRGVPGFYSSDHIPTREHARQQAEEAYQKLHPIGSDTGGHDSGVDYSDLNKFMGEL